MRAARERLIRSAIVRGVIAVFVPGLLLSGCGSSSAGSDASYLGSTWRLTSVRHAGQEVAIPAAVGATVSFPGAGQIRTDDGVNTATARLTPTSDGFVTSHAAVTAAGSVGLDEVASTAVSAIDSLTTAAGTAAGDTGPAVSVELSAGRLALTTGDYRMTFDRGGPAAG